MSNFWQITWKSLGGPPGNVRKSARSVQPRFLLLPGVPPTILQFRPHEKALNNAWSLRLSTNDSGIHGCLLLPTLTTSAVPCGGTWRPRTIPCTTYRLGRFLRSRQTGRGAPLSRTVSFGLHALGLIHDAPTTITVTRRSPAAPRPSTIRSATRRPLEKFFKQRCPSNGLWLCGMVVPGRRWHGKEYRLRASFDSRSLFVFLIRRRCTKAVNCHSACG